MVQRLLIERIFPFRGAGLRFLLLLLLLLVYRALSPAEGKATVEQMMKSGEMMRSVCVGKTKVSVELVDGLRESKFADVKELKCYVNCLMEMMQTMRKGKLNYDASIKQIDTIMPDELAGPMRAALDICRTAADGIKNNCDAAYAMLQCLSKNNPKFIFP
ncbi:general odorant-binding protein 72-like [Anopheles albimanus]|uniref:Odorant-binding protein 5 n=1 Tax=Anopheles albimanus TaxID=7167 RepID=A0A182F9P2_ANOAL|nr:general odorant-binding protein 72-like [Anopheles albimanus]XP_035784122.1 general odorant-binding protein 72-like [Anopheles albimanus]